MKKLSPLMFVLFAVVIIGLVSLGISSRAASQNNFPAQDGSHPFSLPIVLQSLLPQSSGIPSFSHVYVIVMENRGYNAIVGYHGAPYINSLIKSYGLAINYTGVAHPSEPNYLALFSGSTQGISNDGNYNFQGKNLADQLEAKGKTWKVYAQNVPLDCFPGAISMGGEDGSGTYARKHEPAISFTDISSSAQRCANITDFTHFDPAAANYELIIPNECNDMHNCTVEAGDAFLKGFVPKILDSSAWQQGGVLFITWDEGEGDPGFKVATLVISNSVPVGFTSSTPHDHYSLLRTIEDGWGLGCLNETCKANNMREFFAKTH
jgi:phosphatidylinositol-3-phosphatase